MAYTADKAFELLAAAHERGRLAHAFLISGASGSGKEDLAARLIHHINRAPVARAAAAAAAPEGDGGFDLFGEPVAAAPPSPVAEEPGDAPPLDDLESGWVRVIRPRKKSRRIGVDEIRDLEHTLHLAAPGGKTKVGVIVEADRMGDPASNAFLKTLEEPPDGTLLLLLTTLPQRLLPTILSRCVRLTLLGGRPLSEGDGGDLVRALNRAAKHGFGNPVAALHLKAVFAEFLATHRAAVDAAAKAAEKEETVAYRDTTDGTWLKDREDFHKAAAQAEYLDARNRLFDVLLAWMADLLRLKSGGAGLDFPDTAEALRTIAENESATRLLDRMSALEDLRRTLETNAFEPLAIEVGFLKAFG